MGIMGWSQTAMAARYQHVTNAVRRDVANRVGGLLWNSDEGAASGPGEGRSHTSTETTNETTP
jgi:integrase